MMRLAARVNCSSPCMSFTPGFKSHPVELGSYKTQAVSYVTGMLKEELSEVNQAGKACSGV